MIVPVESRADRLAFLDVPGRIYRGTPGWTPTYRGSDLRFHDPARGPFFTFGTAQSFLARDGPRLRGRVTAHVNHAYNAHHHTRVGGFGFLDAEPDENVVRALLESAETWLRRQGVTEVWGPMDFCFYDRVGLQIAGFEHPLPMGAAHHSPQLHAIVESAGYTKKKDVVVFSLPAPHAPPLGVGRAMAVSGAHGITVRRYQPRRLLDEARTVREVVDRAFGEHWLHFPCPDALMQFHAEEMRALLGPANVLFAEIGGEPVGVTIMLPDIGPLLTATAGRLIPWGLPGLWRQRRRPVELLVVLLAVVPECHSLGVVAHLLDAMVRTGIQRHCRRMCTTWVDEDNGRMINTFRRFAGSPYVRYRIFEKPLSHVPIIV